MSIFRINFNNNVYKFIPTMKPTHKIMTNPNNIDNNYLVT